MRTPHFPILRQHHMDPPPLQATSANLVHAEKGRQRAADLPMRASAKYPDC